MRNPKNAGRGSTWNAPKLTKTKGIRVPEPLADALVQLRNKGIDLEEILKRLNTASKIVKPTKTIKNVKKAKQQQIWDAELVIFALHLYNQGKNGAEVWQASKDKGFDPLPSKSNMKRWLDKQITALAKK